MNQVNILKNAPEFNRNHEYLVVSLSFRDELQANRGTISQDWGILPNTVGKPDTIKSSSVVQT